MLIHAKAFALGRAFTPLTLPMTIDAGVISVAITVGANHAHSFKHAVIQLLAAGIGAGIIALSILLTYRYAQRLMRLNRRAVLNLFSGQLHQHGFAGRIDAAERVRRNQHLLPRQPVSGVRDDIRTAQVRSLK